MNTIIVSTERPGDDWDTFVQRHPHGTIYHTSEWMDVIEQSFKHITGYLISIRNSKGEIIGGLPVYLVNSWLTGRRLVSAPFASVFDALVDDREKLNRILDVVIEIKKKNKCRYLELRTKRNALLFEKNKEFRLEKLYKQHFIRLTEPEQLKKKFARTSVRQPITRSLKFGIELLIGKEERFLRSFYDVYSKNRKRLGLPIQPYNFFRNILNIFSKSDAVSILLARKNNSTLAGVIALKYKHIFSLEYGGSDAKFKQFYPIHFLYWNAIKYAYTEGFELFDFGRTATSNAGLLAFKRRWGTEVIDLPVFYYPASVRSLSSDKNNSVNYKLAKLVFRYSPLFCSHLLGKMLYRHMG